MQKGLDQGRGSMEITGTCRNAVMALRVWCILSPD